MEQIRVFQMDGDALAVPFRCSQELNRQLGDYPDFASDPRHTPNGRPWVNVTMEDCPFATQPYNDCGSCCYLRKEHEQDLIGVCFHEGRRDRDE